METKELKITPPEGYEIDRENSTFDCIKFKPKKLTYDSIVKEYFSTHNMYSIGCTGDICSGNISYYCANNGTSVKQLEKLLAINKLMNVAKYLNNGWKPNWNIDSEFKHHLYIGENPNVINTAIHTKCGSGVVYFKSADDARQAIEILGRDTIKLALSTDW